MPLQGYQDWERVSFESGFNLLSIETSILINRANGAFNTEAWSNLLISLSAPGGSDHYQVMFVWYADQAATIELAQNFVVVGPNTLCNMAIPVQGPWLWIFVNVKAGANATAVNFTFYAQGVSYTQFDMNTYSTPLIGATSVLALNTSATLSMTAIYSGNCLLTVDGSVAAATFRVRVQYYDWATGGFLDLLRFVGMTGNPGLRQNLSLVSAPAQVIVDNFGTAQTLITQLVPLP
jgi:hypothetical protein